MRDLRKDLRHSVVCQACPRDGRANGDPTNRYTATARGGPATIHIYRQDEIGRLMAAARNLFSPRGLRCHTYYHLVGLLS